MHKKIISLALIAVLSFGFGTSVLAQGLGRDSTSIMFLDGVEKQEATEAPYIAMLFYRLTKGWPNFKDWAKVSKAYKNAPDYDKDLVLESQEDFFKDRFRQLDVKDPLIVHMPSTISVYSKKNGGFYVSSFRSDLFFSYEHMGNNFALIPTDIEFYQWYQPSEEDLELSGLDFSKENEVDLQIMLTPTAANAKEPSLLGEKYHWFISAEVKEIQMWSKDGRLLWTAQKAGVDNTLLDFYRK